ncbi:MAG: hypothetical protein JKY92_03380 [Magnetovibrio sp.]|nr:hypothetical protein [Magnetovibrio sp.]
MTDQPKRDDDFFLGVMILKENKWWPHSKFASGELGHALMKAEEADTAPGIEGSKIVKISKSGAVPEKEMWISPRIKARAEADKAKQLRSGMQQTNANLAAARRAPIKKK